MVRCRAIILQEDLPWVSDSLQGSLVNYPTKPESLERVIDCSNFEKLLVDYQDSFLYVKGQPEIMVSRIRNIYQKIINHVLGTEAFNMTGPDYVNQLVEKYVLFSN